MGNSGTKFEHGRIYLKTDSPFTRSDQKLTGYVYLMLHFPYQAKELTVTLKDIEKVSWQEYREKKILYR
jgi:exonuclease I